MNSSSMSAGAVPTIKCEDASSPAGAGEGGANDAQTGTYNLSVNVNLSAVSNLLAAESGANTPRTPEILNSVIAMTNPLENYNSNCNEKISSVAYKHGICNDSNSSSMSNASSATSPASKTPPSIQKTCSDLIKAGLKLSIESKRKMSGSDSEGGVKRFKKEESDDEYDSSSQVNMSTSEGLTPEDEERRRRRRERNKIAATKCRMKKRERTVNLVTESQVLESQNIDLKSQLKDLEVQRRQLIDMLSVHTASCNKNGTSVSPTATYNIIRPYESPTPFPSCEANSPYIRPESAHVLASSYTCTTSINGDSSLDTITSLENAYMTPQLIEADYHRPESVMSLPPVTEQSYVTTDGYLPKAASMLVIDPTENEYYETEANYINSQQCHVYQATVSDSQSKMNSGLNDGCLV